jgi:lipid II:glycine glycyltransferase (peptidoglycan interpeptide bridge formation enzyme)
MHGASIAGKGNLHPAESLHWEIIRWARSRGCIFYDLGGTGTDYPPREDNPNYSLYHFKKGFGAKLHYLTGYYDLVFRKGTYTAFRALEERALPRALDFVSRWKKRRHH